MTQYPYTDKKDTRSGFGAGMTELGRTNPQVVTLCADLVGSLKIDTFIKENPERFFQCGISEANMIGISAGLTIGGKIPFATTFANFGSSRVFDQVRQAVAYSNKNVKIAVSHAGLTLGEDGATHQVLEDLAMMKALPNMTVINPCDYNQTKQATIASAAHEGPVYLRFGRPVIPVFIPEDMPFEIGKAITLNEGTDVSIFATGHLVWEALQACQILEDQGISAEIINIHTIKPLDVDAILASVKKTGCCVSAEEHQVNGGLGESIAHVLITQYLAPQEFVGVKDTFGESGTPDELMAKYGLKAENIVEAAKKAIARKAK
ncbi:transketolase family protein [Siphonobacter aquaeclarae]|uniref:Transketolase n=1 Tax=Siphonobacter aquaeclarae TaxID=563176 RepID=A0A1G9KDW6_9BACT|nr:transketolase C-terminal domain-containing protein [Siphonobacter aquaeclarae]SDL48008.1 transketolase [Siphonobacter aquaeclarae]